LKEKKKKFYGISSLSIKFLNIEFSPNKFSCPKKCSSDDGRILSARGAEERLLKLLGILFGLRVSLSTVFGLCSLPFDFSTFLKFSP